MELNFKKFEDIKVSTKTFIIMTNLEIDIKKLFDFLPITEYIVIPKKRGRKKKEIVKDPNQDIKDGSIITLDLANSVRGVLLKNKKKRKDGRTNYFRNSITIVMIMNSKKINFKISRNGKFQMTGCKTDEQAEKCVKQIYEYIKDNKEIYKMKDSNFKALFIPAMRNIDFSLGFIVDREKLNSFINNNNDLSFRSILETSIGYAGVNIKAPVNMPIQSIMLKQLTNEDGIYKEEKVPFSVYLDSLSEKERQKKIDKDDYRVNTFLIFQSGKVIMSSMCEDFARNSYNEFIDIVKKYHHIFQEKLEI